MCIHLQNGSKRVVSYNPSVFPQNSHGSLGLRVTFPKTNSSHLAGSLSKRKLIFQPQCFRCELLASGRVYPTTNDQPSGLFGTFKSFPRTLALRPPWPFGDHFHQLYRLWSSPTKLVKLPQKTSESFDGWYLIDTCINNYMCVYIYMYILLCWLFSSETLWPEMEYNHIHVGSTVLETQLAKNLWIFQPSTRCSMIFERRWVMVSWCRV